MVQAEGLPGFGEKAVQGQETGRLDNDKECKVSMDANRRRTRTLLLESVKNQPTCSRSSKITRCPSRARFWLREAVVT